jgi:hypothetical protein
MPGSASYRLEGKILAVKEVLHISVTRCFLKAALSGSF